MGSGRDGQRGGDRGRDGKKGKWAEKLKIVGWGEIEAWKKRWVASGIDIEGQWGRGREVSYWISALCYQDNVGYMLYYMPDRGEWEAYDSVDPCR